MQIYFLITNVLIITKHGDHTRPFVTFPARYTQAGMAAFLEHWVLLAACLVGIAGWLRWRCPGCGCLFAFVCCYARTAGHPQAAAWRPPPFAKCADS